MHLKTHRAYLASLCVVLLLVAAACSDDPVDGEKEARDTGADISADVGPGEDINNRPGEDVDVSVEEDADIGPGGDVDTDTDTGIATGLRLEGQLVPKGGLSMSSSFTLSGHLSSGMPLQKSSSASFRMELTPAQSEADTP